MEKCVVSKLGKIVIPKMATHYDNLEVMFSCEFSIV